MLRVLSLGAGVQSSTILLMSAAGELPRLDVAIFADTGDEPGEVYDWLEYLKEQVTGIPIVTASRGYSITEHFQERLPESRRVDCTPLWVRGEDGREAPIIRGCTVEWKINVVRREVKKMLGCSRYGRWPKHLAVETWLGISREEISRMKQSTDIWQRFFHPLIEDRHSLDLWGYDLLPKEKRLSREDCLDWCRQNGHPTPPSSSCWHCPFHGNARWRHIRDNCPDDWDRAVEFDNFIRQHGLKGAKELPYLHRSLVPLGQANLDPNTSETFEEECLGVCGV